MNEEELRIIEENAIAFNNSLKSKTAGISFLIGVIKAQGDMIDELKEWKEKYWDLRTEVDVK